jgi:hypothetical protein
MVKDIINGVAKKRLMGKLPLNASVFALPGGTVFTLSLTPMGHDPSTEEIIRDNSPAELRRLLGIKYKEQYGIDFLDKKQTINKLLYNPNYTPRQQAYIWRYITDLSALSNRVAAIKFLADVKSHARAGVVLAQLEMLSLLHQRGYPLDRFVPVRNTLGALDKNETLCLVISIDTVRYWSDVQKSLKLSVNAARRQGVRNITLWSTGDVDKKSVALASSMGVRVYQNILQYPVFQKPRQRRGVDKTSSK